MVKTKKKTDNKEKRTPIINNTYAVYQTKKLLKQTYFSFEKIIIGIENFIQQIESAVEYSRKGQSNPRKPYKGRERAFSQNYKTV